MDESPFTPPPPSEEAVPEPGPGRFRRVPDTFFAPRRAFAPPVPKTAWIIPLIIIAAVLAVESYLVGPLKIEKMEQGLRQSDLPADALDRALEGIEERKEAGPESMVPAFAITAILVGLAAFLFPGLLYWIGANFVAGGSGGYWSIVSVVALSHLVFVVRSILVTPLRLAKGSLHVFTSLALIPVAEAGSKLSNALNVFCLFDIWYIVLASLGLSMVAGIRRGQSLGIVISIWAVWSIIYAAFLYVATGTWWGAAFIGI